MSRVWGCRPRGVATALVERAAYVPRPGVRRTARAAVAGKAKVAAIGGGGLVCAAIPGATIWVSGEAVPSGAEGASQAGAPVFIVGGDGGPLLVPAAAPVSVPEPGSVAVMLAAVAALAVARRWKSGGRYGRD